MRAVKDKERSRSTGRRGQGHRHTRDYSPLAVCRTSVAGSCAAAAAAGAVEEALIPAVRRAGCVVVAGHTNGSEVAAGRMAALADLAEEGTSCDAAVVPAAEGTNCYVAVALAAEDTGSGSDAGPEPGDLEPETDKTGYRTAPVMMAVGRMWEVPNRCSLLTVLS